MNLEWFKEMDAKEKILVIGGGGLAGYFLFRALFSHKVETVNTGAQDVAGALTELADENTQFQNSVIQYIDDFQKGFTQTQEEQMVEINDLLTQLSTTPTPAVDTAPEGSKTPTIVYVKDPTPESSPAQSPAKPQDNSGRTNQVVYLDNLITTGDAGQQAWAKNESQKIYLGNLITTGDAGQQAWARSELAKLP